MLTDSAKVFIPTIKSFLKIRAQQNALHMFRGAKRGLRREIANYFGVTLPPLNARHSDPDYDSNNDDRAEVWADKVLNSIQRKMDGEK